LLTESFVKRKWLKWITQNFSKYILVICAFNRCILYIPFIIFPRIFSLLIYLHWIFFHNPDTFHSVAFSRTIIHLLLEKTNFKMYILVAIFHVYCSFLLATSWHFVYLHMYVYYSVITNFFLSLRCYKYYYYYY